MEKFLFVFVHLGIPALIVMSLIFNAAKSRLGKIFTLILCLSLLVFLYFWGQWPIAFSLYFKYVLPILFIACTIKFFRSWNAKSKWWPNGIWSVTRTLITTISAIFVTYLATQVIRGRSYNQPESVSLNFPLKEGRYYAALGGSNRTINNHYGTSFRAQWYALDFNKLTNFGAVASPLLSNENESHAIFGETVFCPCNGVVIEAKAHVEDNPGATMDVSIEDGMGNYISLDCNGDIITMVHLKQNSLLVQLGEKVKIGQALARVGNSGFSQEPHLHIQAARYNQDSVLVGLPMQFKGRFLVRNDVFEN